MAKKGTIVKRLGQEHRQELVRLIKQASHTHPAWRIWDDLMYFAAASFAQPLQWVQAREDEYLRRIGTYSKETQALFPQMIAEIVLAYEQEGFIDVLGGIYGSSNLVVG